MLRNQNEAVKAHVNRRQKALCKGRRSIAEDPIPSYYSSPRILSSLAESEESHSVSFFVSTFVIYPRDPRADRGFLEHLPRLFGELRVGSPLSLSLTAASRILYSKWERKRKDVETFSYPDYGLALEATRIALEDPVQSMTDQTLMAVCLLGFYEVSVDGEMVEWISGSRRLQLLRPCADSSRQHQALSAPESPLQDISTVLLQY